MGWLSSPPEAVIAKRGRFVYSFHISDGMSSYGPEGGDWYILGWTTAHARRRAERKARKELAKYIASEHPETHRITLDPPE